MTDGIAPETLNIEPAAPAPDGGGNPVHGDSGSASGGGFDPSQLADDGSIEAIIRAEFDKVDKEPEQDPDADAESDDGEPEEKPEAKESKKAEAKPKGDQKPQETENEAEGVKDEAADGEDKDADPEDQQGQREHSRGKKRIIEAPESFLPRAKEAWINVPVAVREEVHRLTTEHQQEVEQYREATARYDDVREFDDLARQNGGTLRDSLTRYVELENLMQQSPLRALNEILMTAGPRKADGSPITLQEVAQFVVQQGPDGYNRMMRQQSAPQQPPAQPVREIEQLRQELHSMKVQMSAQSIIEPFARENPRFNELQAPIAKLLESGMVPASLSPEDRLAVAYDMAVRLNPSTSVDYEPQQDREPLATEKSRAGDFGGVKPIRSSIGGSPEVADRVPNSVEESVRQAARRYRL